MEAATAVAVVSPPPAKRRANLAQLLGFAAGAALLVAGAFYALRYVSATTFDQQRAFRSLDETAGQLDNLQAALAGLLKLMRDDLFKGCTSEKCEAKDAYRKRLAIEGVEPDLVSVDKRVTSRACVDGGADSLFVLRTGQPDVPSVAVRCIVVQRAAKPAAAAPEPSEPAVAIKQAAQQAKPEEAQEIRVHGLKGSLTDIVAGFISQSFFDEVLIALGDGTVIASVPRSDAFANDIRKPLHPARSVRLNIADASDLLALQAAASGAGSAAGQAAAHATPTAQPITFSHTIAGDRYQVFVRLMRPKYPIYVNDDTVKEPQQQQVIYLVGLRRANLSGDLASSMGPVSRFWLTTFFLLALFVWPLASVKSKPAAEAISWSELVACLFSLVFIPATLAIAAVWCWSYLALERWADRGAANYAKSIEAYLQQELRQDFELLLAYRKQRGSGTDECGWDKRAGLPIRAGVHATELKLDKGSEDTCRLVPADGKTAWSPMSSVFATDEEGFRKGGLTAYSAPIVQKNAPYAARQYFQAMRLNQGWSAPQIVDIPFVAQRVFSLSDGSRVLQLAIRRTCAQAEGNSFCGIIGGGSRFHGLSAAVLPPLLTFAVIDRNTGSVLFHADDRRSLAENLFVETEQNESLRAAASANRGAYFNGRYLGEAHRFVYLPMDGLPWGIVVMYSLREMGELPWHAALTALAGYAGLILIIAPVVALLLYLRVRWRDNAKNFAYVLWPRQHLPASNDGAVTRLWRGACFYELCGLGFYGFVVSAVVGYELIELKKLSLLTSVMVGLWFLAAALIILLRRHELWGAASDDRNASARPHAACLAIGLILISALPAAWMAIGYQDAQVQGLVRDGLLAASQAVVRRHDIIERDLTRWRANLEGPGPDAWELTAPSAAIRVPGFAAGDCNSVAAKPSGTWALCVFEPPPLNRAIATLTLDFWRRETWRAAAPTEKQLRRIALLTRTKPSQDPSQDPSCDGYPESSDNRLSWTRCTFGGADEHAFTLAAFRPPKPESKAQSKSKAEVDAWESIASDDAKFSTAMGSIFNLLPALIVLMLVAALAAFANRRLFGHESEREPGRESTNERMLYYTRVAADELDKSPGDAARQPINLAYSPLFLRATRFMPIRQTYLLEDLDLALADASRRGSILTWLEELVDSGAKVIITCRRAPLERLERTAPAEALRWHALFRSLSSATRPGNAGALSDRERWQLYTREERVLLHQIASGVIANPRNSRTLQNLAARGDIVFDPWPTIANRDFAAFVRNVGTEPEMTELLQQSAAGNKSTRRTLIGLLLFVVLLIVLWFSWAAGDQFKIVSTILAGAVAFLGQIGQAFSFVRTAGQGGK